MNQIGQEYLSSLVGREVTFEKGHYTFPTSEQTVVEGYGNAKAFAKGFVKGRGSRCQNKVFPLIIKESYSKQKGVKYFSVNIGDVTVFSTYSKGKLSSYINGFDHGMNYSE